MSRKGMEVGVVTGRKRRCGWFDAPALKRSIQINGITGLCITKLDVLDGLTELKICTAYEFRGKTLDLFPVGAEDVAECKPIFETLQGWKESTKGATTESALPKAALDYLARIEALCEIPVDIISTGPERAETLLRRHPFD
jgi:adenylosuccinate synthase